MKVEQEFFIGVLDADAEKRVKNTTLLKIFSDMSMYHGVVAGHTKPDRKSDISWIVLNWVMKMIADTIRLARYSTLACPERIRAARTAGRIR